MTSHKSPTLRLIKSNSEIENNRATATDFLDHEQVYSKIIHAYENRLLSRRLKESYIKHNASVINDFFEYTSLYPWEWTTEDFEDWSAYIYTHKGNCESTQRGKQGIIDRFQHFLVESPSYSNLCFKLFGKRPIEICNDLNKIAHKLDDENKEKRIAFTKEELGNLWQYFDEQIEIANKENKKDLKTLQRDKILYLFIYYYGLRVREASRITTLDFIRNPQKPEWGNFGGVFIKYGKSSSGSPPKSRIVWTISPVIIDCMKWYLKHVRPKFAFDESNWLFPSSRNSGLSTNSITRNFNNHLTRMGFSKKNYSTHCLRHSYVSHIAEKDDISPRFVQEQVGHEYLATTQIYTHLPDSFINKHLNKVINEQINKYISEGDDDD